MDRLEKILIYGSLTLMALFTAMVLYASMSMGIHLPTSHHDIAPFTDAKIETADNSHFQVHYVARMWSFEPAELLLPENAMVHFYVSAADVNHGFQIVGTNVNLMAVPGTVNAAQHQFRKKGEYLVVCHEYCGLNHQNMLGRIRVLPPEEYARQMQEIAGRLTAAGEKLLVDKDCASCHSTDGTEGIGPTFKGIYGRKVKLTDGREIVSDDAYLANSITNPDGQIVLNYEAGSMPPGELTEQELQQIIEYIKTLK